MCLPMSLETISGSSASAETSSHQLIDCDFHVNTPPISELHNYMPGAWARRFEMSGFDVPATQFTRKSAPVVDLGAAHDLLQVSGRIDGTLLIPVQAARAGLWTDAAGAAVVTAAMNQYLMENWQLKDRRNPRFLLAMAVSPLDPESAAASIRNFSADSAESEGIAAVLLPQAGSILLGNNYYYPIYDAASDVGLPIVFHPSGAEGSYLGGPPLAGGIPRTSPERRVLRGQVAEANLWSLIFRGVFERFPTIRFLFGDWGASWVVSALWRMDLEWRDFRYEVPWVKVAPSEYVYERARFAIHPWEETEDVEQFWNFAKLMQAERTLVLGGLDVNNLESSLHSVSEALGLLPADMRKRIALESAQEILGGEASSIEAKGQRREGNAGTTKLP